MVAVGVTVEVGVGVCVDVVFAAGGRSDTARGVPRPWNSDVERLQRV